MLLCTPSQISKGLSVSIQKHLNLSKQVTFQDFAGEDNERFSFAFFSFCTESLFVMLFFPNWLGVKNSCLVEGQTSSLGAQRSCGFQFVAFESPQDHIHISCRSIIHLKKTHRQSTCASRWLQTWIYINDVFGATRFDGEGRCFSRDWSPTCYMPVKRMRCFIHISWAAFLPEMCPLTRLLVLRSASSGLEFQLPELHLSAWGGSQCRRWCSKVEVRPWSNFRQLRSVHIHITLMRNCFLRNCLSPLGPVVLSHQHHLTHVSVSAEM